MLATDFQCSFVCLQKCDIITHNESYWTFLIDIWTLLTAVCGLTHGFSFRPKLRYHSERKTISTISIFLHIDELWDYSQRWTLPVFKLFYIFNDFLCFLFLKSLYFLLSNFPQQTAHSIKTQNYNQQFNSWPRDKYQIPSYVTRSAQYRVYKLLFRTLDSARK